MLTFTRTATETRRDYSSVCCTWEYRIPRRHGLERKFKRLARRANSRRQYFTVFHEGCRYRAIIESRESRPRSAHVKYVVTGTHYTRRSHRRYYDQIDRENAALHQSRGR